MGRASRHARWEMAAGGSAPFTPAQVSKVSAWLRLAASTITAGEYDAVVDVLNSNPTAQTDTDRKPAAATAANGLPVTTFDGSDMLLWTLAASNASTAAWELLGYIKPANVATTQRIYAADTSSGASVNRLRVGINSNGGVNVLVFITNANGRTFDTPNSSLTAGVWTFLRVAYDSAKTAECDTDGATADAKLRVFLNGTAQAITAGDVGAGGSIGALRAVTGTAIIGAANDADAPVAPLLNGTQVGPNIMIANAAVTTSEAAAIQGFEAPS